MITAEEAGKISADSKDQLAKKMKDKCEKFMVDIDKCVSHAASHGLNSYKHHIPASEISLEEVNCLAKMIRALGYAVLLDTTNSPIDTRFTKTFAISW